jgi:hypothetical protein
MVDIYICDIGNNLDTIPLIITPTGAETINGADGVRILNNYNSVSLVALSNVWYIR